MQARATVDGSRIEDFDADFSPANVEKGDDAGQEAEESQGDGGGVERPPENQLRFSRPDTRRVAWLPALWIR